MTVQGIVVIGENRSGTKWLTNCLAETGGIFSVSNADHTGILETNLLSSFLNKFNFEREDEKCGFLASWYQTDFATECRLSLIECWSLLKNCSNSVSFYFRLMEYLAKREKCDYYLLKCSPDIYNIHNIDFAKCKVIVIQRNRESIVRSQAQLYFSLGQRAYPVKQIVFSHYNRSIMSRILKKCPSQSIGRVTYEEMVKDLQSSIRQLSNQLAIPFNQNATGKKWEKNTSFDKSKKEVQKLSSILLKVKIVDYLLILLPFRIYDYAYKAYCTQLRSPFNITRRSYSQFLNKIEPTRIN